MMNIKWPLVALVAAGFFIADSADVSAAPAKAGKQKQTAAQSHPNNYRVAQRRPLPPPPIRPVRRGPVVVVPNNRWRYYNNVRIYRPYGPWYYGYGPYYNDNQAAKWLALTAITFAVLNQLNESQERALEEAQIKATTAPVGEAITWSDGGASGTVTTIRQGTSTSGRECREFQQTATVGGQSGSGTGTACLQADGHWEIVSTGE